MWFFQAFIVHIKFYLCKIQNVICIHIKVSSSTMWCHNPISLVRYLGDIHFPIKKMYHIISYHIISYHIMSNHMISYIIIHIISHHIISYDIKTPSYVTCVVKSDFWDTGWVLKNKIIKTPDEYTRFEEMTLTSELCYVDRPMGVSEY